MYYIISEKLLECTKEEMIESKKQYVALLSSEAWEKEKNTFKMGIDFEPKTTNIHREPVTTHYFWLLLPPYVYLDGSTLLLYLIT